MSASVADDVASASFRAEPATFNALSTDNAKLKAELRSATKDLNAAQQTWAALPIAERLTVLRRARHAMAASSADFVDAISPALLRTEADTLVSEVLPLLDACKFLERNTARILRTRKLGRSGRPAWLTGVASEVRREAFGHVLLIAPANFPLFLAGVQCLQALAAGNRVTWKPGNGGRAVALVFARALRQAGLPEALLTVTGESVADAEAALAAGADKVVFTGSAANGKQVLATLARTATPAIMELSGEDAMIVLPGADIAETARALAFALGLNGGAVCMCPRRIIAAHETLVALRVRVRALLGDDCAAFNALAWHEAATESEITRLVSASPFALTVSIFHGRDELRIAQALAASIKAGCVLLNDVIAPTADPRTPFGGRGASGFGVTRGAEGLLEMTAPKVVFTRASGGHARHFTPTASAHRAFFSGWLAAAHGGTWRERWRGVRMLIRSARAVQNAAKATQEKTQ